MSKEEFQHPEIPGVQHPPTISLQDTPANLAVDFHIRTSRHFREDVVSFRGNAKINQHPKGANHSDLNLYGLSVPH